MGSDSFPRAAHESLETRVHGLYALADYDGMNVVAAPVS
jgi:hypothetical protein